MPYTYPQRPSTLGQHICKRRTDLGLTQRELAERFAVHPRTIHYWERGLDNPHIGFGPEIVAFLGYDPFPVQESAAGALRAYRIRQGLTQTALANLLGVHPEAVSNWERGRQRPSADNALRIEKLFEGTCEG